MLYDNVITFLILSLLEVILGIDNLIFISLLTGRISPEFSNKIRILGLTLALIMRIIILFGVTILLSLNKPIISLLKIDLSVKDLIMIAGGAFLIYKSIIEIWHDITDDHKKQKISTQPKTSFKSAIIQIILVDLVFSIDSILTAIGMTHNIIVISCAFIVAMIVMILLSGYTVKWINSYPQIKTIAIVFIFSIGILLVLDGLHIEVPRNYIYCAFLFSIFVESINIIKKRLLSPK